MNAPLFAHMHAIDGELILVAHGDNVKLSCRWPFDIDADDYILIENVYRLADYSEAVRTAMNGEAARIAGTEGGYLEISPRQDGFDLDFSNSADGFMRKTLHLKFDGQLEALRGELNDQHGNER